MTSTLIDQPANQQTILGFLHLSWRPFLLNLLLQILTADPYCRHSSHSLQQANNRNSYRWTLTAIPYSGTLPSEKNLMRILTADAYRRPIQRNLTAYMYSRLLERKVIEDPYSGSRLARDPYRGT